MDEGTVTVKGSSEPSGAVSVREEGAAAAVAEPWILAVTVTLPELSPVREVEEAGDGAT